VAGRFSNTAIHRNSNRIHAFANDVLDDAGMLSLELPDELDFCRFRFVMIQYDLHFVEYRLLGQFTEKLRKVSLHPETWSDRTDQFSTHFRRAAMAEISLRRPSSSETCACHPGILPRIGVIGVLPILVPGTNSAPVISAII